MGESDNPRKLGTPPLGQLYDDLLPMASRSRNREQSQQSDSLNRARPTGRGSTGRELKQRWRLLIEGRVQGVGFRNSCNRRASELTLDGWVRNLSDGSVEVEIEGSPQAIREMRLWCESGPREAKVEHLRASQIPLLGRDWFEVRY